MHTGGGRFDTVRAHQISLTSATLAHARSAATTAAGFDRLSNRGTADAVCLARSLGVTLAPEQAALHQRWLAEQAGWSGKLKTPDNHLPKCVLDLYGSRVFGSTEDGSFDSQLFAWAVECAWISADAPRNRFEVPETWRMLFHEARAFLTIPSGPVATLYRGVGEGDGARRMAWTGTLDVARCSPTASRT